MRIDKIDISSLCPLVSEAEFTVMCDVNNPLTGHDGATFTFGPQKGGTKESLSELEKGIFAFIRSNVFAKRTKIVFTV